MKVPDIIRRAIEIGERNGRLTFDELNELCGTGMEPEDVEDILSALNDAGIWIEEG